MTKAERAECKALAHTIAETLNETVLGAQIEIEQIVLAFGVERAQALLNDALAIEQAGGEMLPSGERRRTPGGVFFRLARDRAQTDNERYATLPIYLKKKLKKANGAAIQPNVAPADGSQLSPRPVSAAVPVAPTRPTFVWAERQSVYQGLSTEKGRATTVKATIIGRPAKIDERQNVVVALFEQTHKLPLGLPKGVPQPPAEPTTYVTYIGAKQWRTVAEALRADPSETLVIEGVCSYDPALPGIALFATKVALKPKGAPKPEGGPVSNQGATPSEISSANEQHAEQSKVNSSAIGAIGTRAANPPGRANVGQSVSGRNVEPAALTDEIRERFVGLRRAEVEARETLGQLKALPAAEQTGLAEALHRLQQIKDDVKRLENQFPALRMI
jgi:hypothetical protein